jgi:hypothetical protein
MTGYVMCVCTYILSEEILVKQQQNMQYADVNDEIGNGVLLSA